MSPEILVTGATGFTGRHVVPRLVAKYGRVTCFVRPSSFRASVEGPGVSFAEGTLDDPTSLERALLGKDTLVNIASLGFGHADAIVGACLSANVKRAIFVSTTSVFTTLPAESKVVRIAAEQAIISSGLDYTILRPTMIYGDPGDRNMIRLIGYLRRLPVIPVLGPGNSLQQPIHVEDLASAIVASLEAPATVGKAYNLSGAAPLTFNDVIDTTCRALGVRRLKLHVPIGLSRSAVRVVTRLLGRSPISDEQILRLNEDKAFDHEEARRDFGFAPRSFEAGISDEVAMTSMGES